MAGKGGITWEKACAQYKQKLEKQYPFYKESLQKYTHLDKPHLDQCLAVLDSIIDFVTLYHLAREHFLTSLNKYKSASMNVHFSK